MIKHALPTLLTALILTLGLPSVYSQVTTASITGVLTAGMPFTLGVETDRARARLTTAGQLRPDLVTGASFDRAIRGINGFKQTGRYLVDAENANSAPVLRGRRISSARAFLSEYFLEKALDRVGLTPSDVEMTSLPRTARAEAFEKGSIDAAVEGEPWLTRTLKQGRVVLWMTAEQMIPNAQAGIIAYGPSLLQGNPQAGKRFLVAYLKAVRQYNQGKTEPNLDILASYFGQDREGLRRTCWPAFRSDGRLNVESILEFQTWAVKKGYLDRVVPAEQFWDPSYIEYANRALETGSH